ncbi:hypothetical protein HDV00_005163 [Rhizophlyctis rosea]|nr:hypothetical protein HDV00_005163 [Rhizophlyctis rosea]
MAHHINIVLCLVALLFVIHTTFAALNECQKSIVEQLTNVFESSRLTFPFDSCDNINDGRGYTAGVVGFTTGTQDAHAVIKVYLTKPNHGDEFSPYLDRLQQLDKSDDSGSTSGLDGFCKAWYAACSNKAFLEAQLDYADGVYYVPSQKFADDLGLTSSVGRGQLYDAAIQHGIGQYGDSLNTIITRTRSAMRSANQPETPKDGASEQQWVTTFFSQRVNILCNPSDKSTQSVWCQSQYRIKSYQYLAARNFNFTGDGDYVTALDNSGKEIQIKCDTGLWGNYVPGPLPDVDDEGGSGGGVPWRMIGIIVAVVLGLLVILVVGCLVWRRRRRRRYRSKFVF